MGDNFKISNNANLLAHAAGYHKLRKHISITHVLATVLRVDRAEGTCDVAPVNDEDGVIYDVRLASVIDGSGKGVFIYPSEETPVIVGMIEGEETKYFLESVSCFDAASIVAQNGFEAALSDDGKLVFNGGDNGALVNIDPLKRILCALDDKIISIIKAIQNAPVVPTDGGASFKAALITSLLNELIPVNKAGLGDNDICH